MKKGKSDQPELIMNKEKAKMAHYHALLPQTNQTLRSKATVLRGLVLLACSLVLGTACAYYYSNYFTSLWPSFLFDQDYFDHGKLIWSKSRPLSATKLAHSVKVHDIYHHLKAFSAIADQYGGSRSPQAGFNASAHYVYETLKTHTNYDLEYQPFDIDVFYNLAPPSLEIADILLDSSSDVDTILNSGSGSLEWKELLVVSGGCSPADFRRANGKIVMLKKEGPCIYREKISYAIKSGAVGVLLWSAFAYQGPAYGRCYDCKHIPALGLSHFAALRILESVANAPSRNASLVSMTTSTAAKKVTTLNVLATTKGGNPERVIVAGSHLDSVPAGPGINDDGSGAATTLQVALEFYRLGLSKHTVQKVIFAFWGAEELGLLGSTYYVQHLAATNQTKLSFIKLSLDNDMLASPNYVRGVYHGKAALQPELRQGSGVIQELFETWFRYQGLEVELGEFDGRSDYAEFMEHGIPSGGLFTGAETIKTPEQARKFGGFVGVPLDPCYHAACDTLLNIQGPGLHVLGQNSAAIGYAVERFAMEKDIVGLLAGDLPLSL